MIRRLVLLALIGFAVGAAPAAADPIGTPGASPTITVTCIIDGQPTTFHAVGTGAAGHVLENKSIAVLLGADVTVLVNGEVVDQYSFAQGANAPGLPVSPCTAFTEFQSSPGVTVRMEFANARILVTPPSPD